MRRLSARRAASVLAEDVEAFERAGCRALAGPRPGRVVLESPAGRGAVVVRLDPAGRFFGGNWALEVSTAEPVLPATAHGLSARGRGLVKQQGMLFRAKRRGDAAAARLAAALSADRALGDALGQVHFEQVSVQPDGRPVIRHLGGSVVWVLFPPLVRPTPLPADQPAAILRALEAFRAAGRAAGAGAAEPATAPRAPAR